MIVQRIIDQQFLRSSHFNFMCLLKTSQTPNGKALSVKSCSLIVKSPACKPEHKDEITLTLGFINYIQTAHFDGVFNVF